MNNVHNKKNKQNKVESTATGKKEKKKESFKLQPEGAFIKSGIF